MLQAFRAAKVALEYDQPGLWDIISPHPHAAGLIASYRRVFRVGTLAHASQQHLPASFLKQVVEPHVWKSYFKFAFVRNPWDLAVSGYRYQVGTLSPQERALNPDVNAMLSRCSSFADVARMYSLIRADMTTFITDESGRDEVDFVGRYETLEQDFAYICERIGIAATLPHENRSEHGSYRDYYTPQTRAIVEEHFARDIERFGYSF